MPTAVNCRLEINQERGLDLTCGMHAQSFQTAFNMSMLHIGARIADHLGHAPDKSSPAMSRARYNATGRISVFASGKCDVISTTSAVDKNHLRFIASAQKCNASFQSNLLRRKVGAIQPLRIAFANLHCEDFTQDIELT